MTSVQINGDEWSVLVLRDEEYEKKHGNDSVGTTDVASKVITLRETNALENETIIHESVHAYLNNLCLSSTDDIGYDNWEEIIAEFTAKNLDKLVKTRDDIKKIVEYYKSFK